MSLVPDPVGRERCPLCQSATAEAGARHVINGIRIVNCGTCGFMFAQDVQPADDVDRFYVEGYHDKRHRDGQRVNATVNTRLLSLFNPSLKGKSLLDIGSGYGLFLHALRDSGARRLVGVELSRAQRNNSISVLNVETYGHLADLSDEDQFDIITSFEVIEHILEPSALISTALSRLKAGGSLIIGTDNFDSDVVGVLGDQFPKWIPHEHVSFFAPRTLEALLNRTGQLNVAGARSFTPWELLARKLLFQFTRGREGGSLRQEADRDATCDRSYRLFALRLLANKLWFELFNRADLDGEMMYVHAIKASRPDGRDADRDISFQSMQAATLRQFKRRANLP
jgi:2-polyprenyl-3-methyl-5-hydroxy-6-metoxy-1,4-benzoquinol methylase